MPAARRFIAERKSNELKDGRQGGGVLIVQGGPYIGLICPLQLLGLADAYGQCDLPLLVLNVVYLLVPEGTTSFCAGRKAGLVIKNAQPEYMEHEIASLLRRADLSTKPSGKDVLPMAGECISEGCPCTCCSHGTGEAEEVDCRIVVKDAQPLKCGPEYLEWKPPCGKLPWPLPTAPELRMARTHGQS